MGSSPGSYSSKTLFGTVALLVFICLLLIGIQEHDGQSGKENATTMKTTVTTQSPEYFRYAEVIGKENLVSHPKLELNYMSKRRVPNGPDPIHNRRAGNSKQPPGKA